MVGVIGDRVVVGVELGSVVCYIGRVRGVIRDGVRGRGCS